MTKCDRARAVPTPAPNIVLQRKCACGGTCSKCKNKAASENAAPDSVHDALRSPGRQLNASARAFMEPRFGQDFSDVRVHDDHAADSSARAVDAHAYTVGSDIVFRSGRYAPGTSSGLQLLAHELTHVTQQRSHSVPGAGGLAIGDATSPAEREADHVAANVLGASPSHVARVSPQPARLARQAAGTTPAKPATNPTPAPAAPESTPPAEQAIGDVKYGSGGKFAADLTRREAIASKGAHPCALFATMRIKFVQADPAAWPAGRFVKWQQEAAKVIGERWSFKYLLERNGACAKNEPCTRSTVIVRMQPVASGEHHTVNVRYLKPASTRSDSLDWYHKDIRRDRDDIRKDHATANHEFGHLLGLDHVAANTKECADARVADPKNPEPEICYGRGREERAGVMGGGEIVRPQDYDPFVSVMNTATGCTWRVDAHSGPVFGTSGAVIGAIAGGLLGAAGGAMLGALFGPLGMGIGALIGGAIGAGLGALIGYAADE